MNLLRYSQADQVHVGAVAVTGDPTDERIAQAYRTVLWIGDLAPLCAALSKGVAHQRINAFLQRLRERKLLQWALASRGRSCDASLK